MLCSEPQEVLPSHSKDWRQFRVISRTGLVYLDQHSATWWRFPVYGLAWTLGMSPESTRKAGPAKVSTSEASHW